MSQKLHFPSARGYHRGSPQNLPDLTRGADQVLLRPESGRIEDTLMHPSAGSRLIVEEAKKASPEKPLLVVAGGPQTTVATALLTNPEIAPNPVVFNLTVTGGYNASRDEFFRVMTTPRLFP